MVTRLRSTWLAGGGAVLLVLSLSGIVAGATLVGDGSGDTVQPADPPAGATDTTLTFEDVDGNGIDDDCQDPAAAANPVAVADALKAADLNGDGTISVSEAAQSGWTGGVNCNHGGYVSGVARGSGDDARGGTTPTTENRTGRGAANDETSPSTELSAATCDEADEARRGGTDHGRMPDRERPPPMRPWTPHRTLTGRRSRRSPSPMRSVARTATTAAPSARQPRRTTPVHTARPRPRPTARARATESPSQT